MKHTPAPWEWIKDKFNGGYSGIVGKDGAEVLFPNHRNDGDTGAAWFEDFPNEADKNLMAAAPELLEALKEIEAQFGYCLPEQYTTKIRDVIDKAQGKPVETKKPTTIGDLIGKDFFK